MDIKNYSHRFQTAAGLLDKKLLNKKQLEVAVGVYGGGSVFLKLYKKSWATPFQDPLTAESRIFFSIWITDLAIKSKRLLYNIHALKLRKLKGYSIESRKFAGAFREGFKDFEHKWQNVSTLFGPLTLMEGWREIDVENFNDDIVELANNFLEIEYLVDQTLAKFK